MTADDQLGALNGESAKIRDARVLRERADAALVSGDYETARKLDRRIAEWVADSDLGREAAQEMGRLRVDPVHVYSGLFALSLYLLGWLVAFW